MGRAYPPRTREATGERREVAGAAQNVLGLVSGVPRQLDAASGGSDDLLRRRFSPEGDAAVAKSIRESISDILPSDFNTFRLPVDNAPSKHAYSRSH